MTQGNINEYISEFQMLGHQAHIDLDDPAALRLFARGLPNGLADSCINLDSPESFALVGKLTYNVNKTLTFLITEGNDFFQFLLQQN